MSHGLDFQNQVLFCFLDFQFFKSMKATVSITRNIKIEYRLKNLLIIGYQ